jgi:hypothetical protein
MVAAAPVQGRHHGPRRAWRHLGGEAWLLTFSRAEHSWARWPVPVGL